MKALILDIGSNSIRSMVAEQSDGKCVFSDKQVFTTRLAEGLTTTGRLSQERMNQSLHVLSDLLREPENRGLPVFAYATSAVRDASNRQTFCDAVRNLGVIELAVLDGSTEARYAFLAATGGNGGMLDIGGGSVQVVTQREAHSFPVGCVRARDMAPTQRLMEIQQILFPRLERIIYPLPKVPDGLLWYGVGGTITTLGAYCQGLANYDKHQVQGFIMSAPMLKDALIALDAMGMEGRSSIPLLQQRKDVLLHGGAILWFLMDRLSIPSVRISDIDGLEGYAAKLGFGQKVEATH